MNYLFLYVLILINFIITSTSIQSKQVDVEGIKTTENDLIRIEEQQLKIDREKFEREKQQIQKSILNTDVIQLNVGGTIIITTRKTLTCISKSILSIIFNGRWEEKLQKDKNRNIFFDFNPIIFRHLLDQLQLFDSQSNTIQLFLPSDRSLVLPFKKMLRKLGLDHFLSTEKNIIHFNVGGQLIINQHKTFSSISHTIDLSSKIKKIDNTIDIFLDYHPKLFRYLIGQVREEPLKNPCILKPPSVKEKIIFDKILNELNICRPLDSAIHINAKKKWKQNGITIAGGNGQGEKLNQFSRPYGIYVDDDDQCIYIADHDNHRIIKWKFEAKTGQVVAGGNDRGNRMNQLDSPTDVIIDKKNDSIIICDYENRRVVKWFRQNNTVGQIIISNITCWGLVMNNDEDLYISDWQKDEVRRWKIDDINNRTIVAGGHGQGNYLNQLKSPGYIVVDKDHSIYVSDWGNHRIVKWVNDAKQGIVVAGGQGQGKNLTQLSHPLGVVVDQMGHIYVADNYNHRIMLWSTGSTEGSIVIGGNGKGQQSNQFNYLRDLSFDRNNNLYVVDWGNHRIQKFDIDST